MIALTMILNDAILSSKGVTEALGGATTDRALYSVRLLASHLWEASKFLRQTMSLPTIKEFIADLPGEVRVAFDRVTTFDNDDAFKAHVQNLRDHSFHYPHPDHPDVRAALIARHRERSATRLCPFSARTHANAGH
jgi:hypothetical protein